MGRTRESDEKRAVGARAFPQQNQPLSPLFQTPVHGGHPPGLLPARGLRAQHHLHLRRACDGARRPARRRRARVAADAAGGGRVRRGRPLRLRLGRPPPADGRAGLAHGVRGWRSAAFSLIAAHRVRAGPRHPAGGAGLARAGRVEPGARLGPQPRHPAGVGGGGRRADQPGRRLRRPGRRGGPPQPGPPGAAPAGPAQLQKLNRLSCGFVLVASHVRAPRPVLFFFYPWWWGSIDGGGGDERDERVMTAVCGYPPPAPPSRARERERERERERSRKGGRPRPTQPQRLASRARSQQGAPAAPPPPLYFCTKVSLGRMCECV